ncbi:hypothetical protein GQR58_024432 [Nymphon striatum]|nr:hypothetical protein GQR58_024432 [Nymphon striatum]
MRCLLNLLILILCFSTPSSTSPQTISHTAQAFSTISVGEKRKENSLNFRPRVKQEIPEYMSLVPTQTLRTFEDFHGPNPAKFEDRFYTTLSHVTKHFSQQYYKFVNLNFNKNKTRLTESNQRHIIPEIGNFMKSHIITPPRDFVVLIIIVEAILAFVEFHTVTKLKSSKLSLNKRSSEWKLRWRPKQSRQTRSVKQKECSPGKNKE